MNSIIFNTTNLAHKFFLALAYCLFNRDINYYSEIKCIPKAKDNSNRNIEQAPPVKSLEARICTQNKGFFQFSTSDIVGRICTELNNINKKDCLSLLSISRDFRTLLNFAKLPVVVTPKEFIGDVKEKKVEFAVANNLALSIRFPDALPLSEEPSYIDQMTECLRVLIENSNSADRDEMLFQKLQKLEVFDLQSVTITSDNKFSLINLINDCPNLTKLYLGRLAASFAIENLKKLTFLFIQGSHDNQVTIRNTTLFLNKLEALTSIKVIMQSGIYLRFGELNNLTHVEFNITKGAAGYMNASGKYPKLESVTYDKQVSVSLIFPIRNGIAMLEKQVEENNLLKMV